MRIQQITQIQKLVEEIMYLDTILNKKTNKPFSICLDGIYSVPTPNNGEIIEIDNNSMVILSFEDTIGTTDWLPISILSNEILSDIFDNLSNMYSSLINECQIKKLNF